MARQNESKWERPKFNLGVLYGDPETDEVGDFLVGDQFEFVEGVDAP